MKREETVLNNPSAAGQQTTLNNGTVPVGVVAPNSNLKCRIYSSPSCSENILDGTNSSTIEEKETEVKDCCRDCHPNVEHLKNLNVTGGKTSPKQQVSDVPKHIYFQVRGKYYPARNGTSPALPSHAQKLGVAICSAEGVNLPCTSNKHL